MSAAIERRFMGQPQGCHPRPPWRHPCESRDPGKATHPEGMQEFLHCFAMNLYPESPLSRG